MDCRSLASPTGTNDYVLYRFGGKSWTIPYLAGIYALACQIKPSINPEDFLDIVFETGNFLDHTDDYSGYNVKKLINPVEIMNTLEETIDDPSDDKNNDILIEFIVGGAIIGGIVGIVVIIYFVTRSKTNAKPMPR